LKMIVCQIFNLSHIYMVSTLKKTHLWYENYQTFHMDHKNSSNYMKSHGSITLQIS
jgi:hypothetical protein